MNDTCFSPSSLVLLAPIVAAIVAGFGVLYRDGLRSRDREVEHCYLLLREANLRLNQGIPVLDEAKTIVRQTAGRK